MPVKERQFKIFSQCYMLTMSLIVALGVMSSSSEAFERESDGGGRVGTGGDWRRIMLDQAQREGANWVNAAALNLDFFDKDPVLDRNSSTYKFAKTKDTLAKLASDMIASGHTYRDNNDAPRREYSTCAWTNDPAAGSLDQIVFSLDRCEGGLLTGGQS